MAPERTTPSEAEESGAPSPGDAAVAAVAAVDDIVHSILVS